jgi:hypothetical protein
MHSGSSRTTSVRVSKDNLETSQPNWKKGQRAKLYFRAPSTIGSGVVMRLARCRRRRNRY